MWSTVRIGMSVTADCAQCLSRHTLTRPDSPLYHSRHDGRGHRTGSQPRFRKVFTLHTEHRIDTSGSVRGSGPWNLRSARAAEPEPRNHAPGRKEASKGPPGRLEGEASQGWGVEGGQVLTPLRGV